MSIEEALLKSLEHYLKNLEGEKPKDLYHLVLKQIEPILLNYVLNLTENNQSEAARLMGLSRITLRKMMSKYQAS